MSLRFGVRARAAALVVFMGVTLSLLEVPQVLAVTGHKPLNDTRPVGSAPVSVDFPIEYFGLVAKLPARSGHLPEKGRAPYGEVRFMIDGRWTSWRTLGADGAQASGQFTGALMSVDRADAYQVRGLPSGASGWRAAAINTTDGPPVVMHRRADAASAAPRCMSRADWGADESISGWTRNDDVRSFAPAQVMTVHHTAGSNDPDQDYAATMRAIYSYHVQSNGWSDIGYQYLIDGRGTVYEGRSSGHTSTSCLSGGGDGSDFAHDLTTDEVVTGAHVSTYNTGNIGISLMGCYEPRSSACTGNMSPPATQVDGLEAELALLADRHDLDPEGTVHYVNSVNGVSKDVSTISGHRDYDGGTACPGGDLHSRLPAIRSNVAGRLAGTAPMDSAVVSFARASRTVREDAGTVELSVTRTGNIDVGASVGYVRTSGTATPDTDFSLAPGRIDFAAGQTTKKVSVSIRSDGAREGRESIVVALTNPRTGTVTGSPARMSVTIAPSDQRPDGWVSAAARTGYVGNDIYNTTAYAQTRRLTADRTQGRTFYLRVYNDGNVKNTFALIGSPARSGSVVRYYSGSTDITTAMRSGDGWAVTLDAGAYKLVKVRIKVLRAAAYGSLLPAKVTGTWSGDGLRADTVKAVVKVAR